MFPMDVSRRIFVPFTLYSPVGAVKGVADGIGKVGRGVEVGVADGLGEGLLDGFVNNVF